MNILFVTPSFPYPPEKDGQTIIAYHLLKELSGRHDIKLICFADKQDYMNQEILTNLGIKTLFIKRPKRSRILYYLSAKSRQSAWFQYRHQTEVLVNELQKADHDPGLDLIFIHSPFFSNYLNYIKYKPVVFSSIDALSSWYNQFQREESNPLKKLHYQLEGQKAKQAEKECYSIAKTIIVVSEIDKEIIKNNCPNTNVITIANGVDLDYFRPSTTPPNPHEIVFTGAMDYPPNIKAVMDFHQKVWPRLKKSEPKLQWLIVGKNPTLDIFELQSLDGQITVTGYVKDIRPYIWRSAVYVAPLKLGTGFKNKIIEAMACGKAIVASPSSVSAIPVEDNKHLLIANDRHEFYEKTLAIINDEQLRKRLEISSRKFSENYSWSYTAGLYEQAFTEALNNKYGSSAK